MYAYFRIEPKPLIKKNKQFCFAKFVSEFRVKHLGSFSELLESPMNIQMFIRQFCDLFFYFPFDKMKRKILFTLNDSFKIQFFKQIISSRYGPEC